MSIATDDQSFEEPARPPALLARDLAYAWDGQGREKSGFQIRVDAFSVAAGERVLLTGSSGSGKSTLLSLICGIVSPQSGVVEIGGAPFSSLAAAERDRFRAERFGVVFQMFNLLPYASALENVLIQLAFAPERRKRLGAGAEAEAARLMRALGLPESVIGAGRASSLSVGQQQRVAAARALIGGPEIVVADEPTSALDRNAQGAFLDLLFDQIDATGATLLMVSHDDTLGERFDHVIELADIAQTTRPETA